MKYEENNTKYPRSMRATITADMGLYPVVAVMGARQVGKSTLCREIGDQKGLAYRTLDDQDVLQQAREDPEGLLAELGEPGAFIDEAQRAPNLFMAIKAVIDRTRRPGQYLLSGSNQPKMTGGVGDSLLGRAAYRTLRPLTLSELRLDEDHPGWSFLFGDDDAAVIKELERRADASGRLDWQDIAKTGGFPRALAAPPEQRMRVLNDYTEVFARRDIREVIGVEANDRFESFLRLVAARTGQELNYSGLSNDLGISVSTVRRWLDALLRSYLIELLPPFSRNAGYRVIKAPKLFMADTAFAMAAAREATPTGFHLENLVATDLGVWKDLDPARGLYHWRLGSGQEVDFVAEERSRFLPVEIKSASSIGASDVRHLRKFRAEYANTPRGLVLSCMPETRVFQGGIVAAPWWGVL